MPPAKLIKEKWFEHGGKKMVVQARACAQGVFVRAYYDDDKPVNHLTYSVTWDTKMDFAAAQGLCATETLMQIAERDAVQA